MKSMAIRQSMTDDVHDLFACRISQFINMVLTKRLKSQNYNYV